uniref:Uncharacterized protein n=1 Tax=Timema shepardi TaxID=629360 RepID=A0A7R9AT24_TIMSH|nr:unnamed protein product [Timema shepardi]
MRPHLRGGKVGKTTLSAPDWDPTPISPFNPGAARYRQRLCRLPGVFLPTLLSERLRKRRAFADRELETALPPPFMSVLSPFPLPLWTPAAPQTPTRPTQPPPPPPSDNDTDAPKPKPKISFSVESIIGVK